jgi:hypothetical protein
MPLTAFPHHDTRRLLWKPPSVDPVNDLTIILPGQTASDLARYRPLQGQTNYKPPPRGSHPERSPGAGRRAPYLRWCSVGTAGVFSVAAFALILVLHCARQRMSSEVGRSDGSAAGTAGHISICPTPFREGHGTSVEFVPTPADASQLACSSRKLLFLLHVSGNFEKPGFT